MANREAETITYDPRTWRNDDGTMPHGLPEREKSTTYLRPKDIAAACDISVRRVYDAISTDSIYGIRALPPGPRRKKHRRVIDARAYAVGIICYGMWGCGIPESAYESDAYSTVDHKSGAKR